MMSGVYYELVCRLCGSGDVAAIGFRISGETAYFRVFSDRLRKALAEARRIVCLAPADPLVFYEAVVEKESRAVSCENTDPAAGHWLECEPSLVESGGSHDVYACSSLRLTWGFQPPYSRAYGCLVELLVVYTKMKAGVLGPEALDYARWLLWCVERSSSVREHVLAARRVLELAERVAGEGSESGRAIL